MSDDLISRQAAIDELEERINANGYVNAALVSELNKCIGYIMRLPSAQPEIIRCKDGKYCYSEGFVNVRNVCEKHYDFGNVDDDWFCADGKER